MPISKPKYITRTKLNNLSLDEIKRGERPLTRELIKEIKNLRSPFEFKENPEITSDSDESDESYIDANEILVRKQQMEESIRNCIIFNSLTTTDNFKHVYSELKLEDIEDEIIGGYFNGICNNKYIELNNQYEIEKTERIQKQIRQIRQEEYETSFSLHLLIAIIFIFIGYFVYNYIIS